MLQVTVKKLANRLGVLIASLTLSAVFGSAASHSAAKMTEAELLVLPEYCQARFAGVKSMAYKSWSERMGPGNFGHIHHYCYGLNYMTRAAMEFDPKKQRFILKQAMRNFDYVLRHWPPEFSLTSSAMFYRQQAEIMLSTMPQ